MHFPTLLGLAASITSAHAVSTGFNYGATKSDGYTAMEQSDFSAQFARAKTLEGTSGEFTSARLYTMIQGGTTDTPSSAFQAAIDTKTSLLLGVWCSAGQTVVTNEINAFKSAVQQYGSAFTSLILGVSVGSEDLYRVSPTGIENDSGAGATPDELVSYIKQMRSALSGTAASHASVGHVDTWTAWVNGSNNAVIDAVDWLGMDTYPYFQTTVANSIETANKTFWDAYDVTAGAGNGKEVWITETGWPVSGKTSGQAVASIPNAETYWQEVACALVGKYNTWWFTLDDSIPTTPNPSFGIIAGEDLSGKPLYDLTCKKTPATTKTTAGGHSTATKKPSSGNNHAAGGGAPYGGSSNHTTAASGSATASGSAAATQPGSGGAASSSSGAPVASTTGNAAVSRQASSAVGAGILAIFAMVAAL